MRQRRREALANDSNSQKVHRREGFLATEQRKPVILLCSTENLPGYSSPA
jgi:hypothetical protein